MKFEQINEAIIKVPPELMNEVNLYTSSALATAYSIALTNAAKYMKEDQYNEVKVKVERVIGKLQSQYGAKILSTDSYNSIMNKTIELPFNAQEFLSQTNININSDAAHAANDTKIFLELTNANREYQGQMSSHKTGARIISIVIKANIQQPLKTVNDVMATANHEAQHVVQDIIVSNVEKSKKTVQADNTDFDSYQSSYVEFGPHLASIAGAMEAVLESMKLNDAYPEDAKEGFRIVFETSVNRNHSFMSFIKAVKAKDQNMYKKAIKQINKSYYELYDKIKSTDVNYAYSSLSESELDANVNTMMSIYHIIKNNRKFELVGIKSDPDNKTDFMIIKCKLFDYFTLTFSKNKEEVSVQLKYGHFNETGVMDTKDVLSFMNSVQYVPEGDADHLFSLYRTGLSSKSNVSVDSVKTMIESVVDICNFFDMKPSSTDESITLDGYDFKIIPTEEQNAVIIQSEKLSHLYFTVTLSQAEMFLLAVCRAFKLAEDDTEIKQDLLKILNDEISFMIIMDKLGDLE